MSLTPDSMFICSMTFSMLFIGGRNFFLPSFFTFLFRLCLILEYKWVKLTKFPFGFKVANTDLPLSSPITVEKIPELLAMKALRSDCNGKLILCALLSSLTKALVRLLGVAFIFDAAFVAFVDQLTGFWDNSQNFFLRFTVRVIT